MLSCSKFVVTLAILASIGFTLAGPLSRNEISHHFAVDRHVRVRRSLFDFVKKWDSVKESCGKLYDSVKDDWPDIKEKAKNLGKHVDEDFEKAKGHTLKLFDKAKKVYKKILINGEDAFDHFHAITHEIEESLDHLQEKGSQVFDDASVVFQTLKQNVDNAEELLKNGDISSAINDFKGSWIKLKNQWNKLDDDFSNLFDSTISDWDKLKKDTKVNINGVTKDLRDVKTEVSDLLKNLRTTYKQITVDGKSSIQQFNDLYSKLKQTLNNLKPIFGDESKEVELVLDEFKNDAQVVVELEESVGVSAAVAEGTIDVVPVVLLA